jgi:single-strand DNA-binding protein
MINKVTLVGNVGKDPDVNYIQPDVAVAKFPLATDESFKRKDGTWDNRSQWHNIVAWRFAAQYVENNIKKGQLVYVEGKIQTRKYEDQNGQEKYITEIIANTIRILNKRDGSEQGSGNTPDNQYQGEPNTQSEPLQNQNNQTMAQNDDPFLSENEGGDDGLPF